MTESIGFEYIDNIYTSSSSGPTLKLKNVSYMYQYVATFSATLLLLSSGFALGWSSPALPQLFADDTPVPVTRNQSAWIVACMEIGVLIVAIPAVWLMDRFGRRRTLLGGIAPIALSWTLIATANSVAALCVARVLGGLTFGLGLSVVPVCHGTFADIVYGRGNRRALLIIVGVTAIQVLCGSLTTIAYAETIFADVVSANSMSAGLVSVVFGSVQLVAATVSAAAVDAVGRRPLLLISVAGTTVCNAVVATWLRLQNEHTDRTLAWLPVVTIMLGVVFYFVGLATVIFALLAELLPAHLRRVGGAVYALVSGALIFGVNKLFQVVSDGWGREAAFGAFAVCGVLFAPFVWRMVPETRGRRLEEIREELEKGG